MADGTEAGADGGGAPAFEPTWDSLRQYRCPDWFRDAKLGIFLHWGPTSVPAAGTAYSRDLYIEGSDAYRHHVRTYGHPSQVGWKDIVPQWKAERWDPDAVVAVFKRAGARYIVPVASFHDNYDLWDSRHHAWNAVQVGPGKDIVGLWRQAALKAGLRFGVSEHLERSYSWFNTNKGADKEGPLAGVPYDGNDPAYADLYFPPHGDTAWWYPADPPEWWKEQWFLRIRDLIDSYRPDLVYTDGAVPFGDWGLRLLAHYYNANRQWHGGRLEAVWNLKNIPNHGEYREGTCVEDLERGTLKGIKQAPWQTDTAIGDWFHNEQWTDYKSPRQVVAMFMDIISKNGNLLLDVALRADGTFPPEELRVLEALERWTAVNGDAVYGTRPWKVFGEGGVNFGGERDHFNESDLPFTARDFRFTRKAGAVYAFALGWPEEGEDFLIRSLDPETLAVEGGVAGVRMLGASEAPDWESGPEGLRIRRPAAKPCEHAFAFEVNLRGTPAA